MGHDLVGSALHDMDGEQVKIEFLVFSVIPRLQPSIGVSACTRDNPHLCHLDSSMEAN